MSLALAKPHALKNLSLSLSLSLSFSLSLSLSPSLSLLHFQGSSINLFGAIT